tara:strand:- start:26 stop:1141 length:1116 start_codon:yes stop_codon:yes gene_type:complete
MFICLSCNTPKLDGHYHLEWDNGSNKFQTWNIKNNRMKINDSICNDEKLSCYGMPIKLKGDSIFVPWVDFLLETKYHIDKQGIIYLESEGNKKALKLVPKIDCLKSETYFNQKLDFITKDFQLTDNNYMFNNGVFPSNYKNELIVGKSNTGNFLLFNNKLLSYNKNKNLYNIPNSPEPEDLWIHIDKRMKMIHVLPIIKECYEKNYLIHFTTQETSENDEQLSILKKSITNFQKKGSSFVLNSCEYCEKYPNQKIDSVIKLKVMGLDSCIVNNKVTNYFQLRNQTSRFLGQNRTTRLNTQIELEINSNILFKDYLKVINELDFVNTELSSIIYYRGKNDPDQKEILRKQNEGNFKDVIFEFPLRIKETFSN